MVQLIMLAACGWFLLVPPPDPQTRDLDITRPYFEWEQKGAFDTVRECETGRKAIEAQVEKAIVKRDKEQQKKHLNEVDRGFNLTLWAQLHGRCIPSDAIFSPTKNK